MNEARDLQHPDITQMERTGEPWFPRRIEVKAAEDDAERFCKEAFGLFFQFLMTACPYAVSGFIDDNEEEFNDFVLSNYGEG